MFRKRRWIPSLAMGVALLSLFLNLAGIGYAATGGNFVLGKSNGARTTTSLTGSPKRGTVLSLNNVTHGLPAAAFKVSGGAQPFTVNSTIQIANLNADLLDGHNADAFQLKSDSVRIDAPQMLPVPASADGWNIGPYIALNASCYASSGTSYLDLSLLNNSPGTGESSVGVLGGSINPATPRVNDGVIQSGGEESASTS
jgi:hypothetical protein